MSNELAVIEYSGQRVVTTSQLADLYGANTDALSKNFSRNKERYEESKHYYALEGKDKNDFINLGQIDGGLKNAKTLYLWTEKGAFLHAKSLNTDKAWEVYDHLVDTYFKAKELVRKLDSYAIEDPVERATAWIEEQRQAHAVIEQLETELVEVKERVKLTRLQVNKLSRALNEKVSGNVGKRVYAYNSHYIAAKATLCAYFNVNTLSEIKQDDYESAMRYIEDEI